MKKINFLPAKTSMYVYVGLLREIAGYYVTIKYSGHSKGWCVCSL